MSRSDRVGAPVPERGQSTVEFALVLPLVALSLLMIVQVALLATTKVATVHTARDVARAIAIDPDACLLYTSPSPRDATLSRMPSSA